MPKKKHPSPKKVSRKYPDYCKRDATLDGCLMIREEVKRTSGKVRKVYFFTHIDFPDDELYICKGFVRITKEGGNEGLFEVAVEHNEESMEGREIPQLTGDVSEDVARFLSDGFVVDDDNLPAPENVPNNAIPHSQDVSFEDWDSATHCNRTSIFGRNETLPTLVNGPSGSDVLEWFLFFLPWNFIVSTITCPVFVYCPRKPHPKGNEYHTIADMGQPFPNQQQIKRLECLAKEQ